MGGPSSRSRRSLSALKWAPALTTGCSQRSVHLLRALCALYPATCTLHPAPKGLLLAPCSPTCSLLAARCSLLPAPCSLLPAPRSLLPDLFPAPKGLRRHSPWRRWHGSGGPLSGQANARLPLFWGSVHVGSTCPPLRCGALAVPRHGPHCAEATRTFRSCLNPEPPTLQSSRRAFPGLSRPRAPVSPSSLGRL